MKQRQLKSLSGAFAVTAPRPAERVWRRPRPGRIGTGRSGRDGAAFEANLTFRGQNNLTAGAAGKSQNAQIGGSCVARDG